MNKGVDLIIEGLEHKDDPTYEEFEVWEEVEEDAEDSDDINEISSMQLAAVIGGTRGYRSGKSSGSSHKARKTKTITVEKDGKIMRKQVDAYQYKQGQKNAKRKDKETKKVMKKSGYKCAWGKYYKDGKEISKEEYDAAKEKAKGKAVRNIKFGKRLKSVRR